MNQETSDPRPKTMRELALIGVYSVSEPVYVVHRTRYDFARHRPMRSISRIVGVYDYSPDGNKLEVVAVSNGYRYSFEVDGGTEILYRLDKG